MTNIVVLGWGSLLWETGTYKGKTFEEGFGGEDLKLDGPTLPIEFSRISEKSRKGVLTLVIDRQHGRPCQVAWRSYRKNTEAERAIEVLRAREGTKCCQIGRYFKNKGASVFKDRESFDAVVTWAKTRSDISTVIWTDLDSNCEELRGEPFSIFNAVSYLEKTPQLDKDKVAEYVWNAAQFVKTALREELETKTWFRALKQSSYSAWVLAKPGRKVHSDSSCDNEAKPAY